MVIERLLSALEQPREVGALAAELDLDQQTLLPLLRMLEARGYVGRAYQNSPSCGTGCGVCSLRNLCPAEGRQAEAVEVWRRVAGAAPTIKNQGSCG